MDGKPPVVYKFTSKYVLKSGSYVTVSETFGNIDVFLLLFSEKNCLVTPPLGGEVSTTQNVFIAGGSMLESKP